MSTERALKLQDPFTNLRSGGPITVKNVRRMMNGENIHSRVQNFHVGNMNLY